MQPEGNADILARLLGQWLSERLGQSFVVENRIASLLTRASQGLRFNKHMDETDGLLVF